MMLRFIWCDSSGASTRLVGRRSNSQTNKKTEIPEDFGIVGMFLLLTEPHMGDPQCVLGYDTGTGGDHKDRHHFVKLDSKHNEKAVPTLEEN